MRKLSLIIPLFLISVYCFGQKSSHIISGIDLNESWYTLTNQSQLSYFVQEDYEGAIQCFNKSIELNPDYAAAYNNRGSCKWNLGYKSTEFCKDWRLAAYRGSKSAQDKLRKRCN